MNAYRDQYAQLFNARHGWTGSLFEGRFGAAAVATDEHLWTLVRYIARNPVEAGLCGSPLDWPWSSLACNGPAPEINLLAEWPIRKPADWLTQVNGHLQEPVRPRGWLHGEAASA